MQENSLSVLTLFLISLVTILAVLLVSEKRANANLVAQAPASAVVAQGESKPELIKYQQPPIAPIREVISLPKPKTTGTVSVETALQNRRSQRFYSDTPVTPAQLSQILWSAQGITDEAGHRSAPSARSAYPYSVYVLVRNVASIADGLYLYNPQENTLGNLGLANASQRLIAAGVQDNAQKAPVVLALVAAPAKMQEKVPDSDPIPSTLIEAGHIGQNIYLQAEALKMATVVTAGFDTKKVAQALELDEKNQLVVYLVPFGHIGVDPATQEPEK